ncbi:hypothetical protein Nepgr_014843 [Nepenthes gracilis]|uniref:Uncharacterized protein n=1 Tax=Nepenthes gracilis TaxID=150966 RepID=A0AAD3XPW0_NEPGR|nr:hypothetical protein Nepgr_014843 [Nepenthes gracilis]
MALLAGQLADRPKLAADAIGASIVLLVMLVNDLFGALGFSNQLIDFPMIYMVHGQPVVDVWKSEVPQRQTAEEAGQPLMQHPDQQAD